MDVIGLGDADIDIYLDVDRIPGRDEKVRAKKLSRYPGGMVANFLVVLRRLGTTCGFHGPLGDDEFGRLVMANLIANEIDTRGVIIRPGGRTYFCVILLDGSGEKALVVAPTDCIYPEPGDLSESLIAEARHLHTTVDNIETAGHAIDIAAQHGLTVSIDVEPSAVEHYRELWPLLAHVDLVFIKEPSLLSLTRGDRLETALPMLLEHGVKTVCVTKGGEGVLVANGTEKTAVAGFPVPVVDSTGAGDAFAAAFVHAFLRNWPLVEAATFASAVGAMIVSHYGGHEGAPTTEEVHSFLASRGIRLSSQ